MSKDIQVTTSHKGNIAVISIKGDVTAVTGEVIEDAYQGEAVLNAPKILLQFDKDCYINSGGLASRLTLPLREEKKTRKSTHSGYQTIFRKYSTWWD